MAVSVDILFEDTKALINGAHFQALPRVGEIIYLRESDMNYVVVSVIHAFDETAPTVQYSTVITVRYVILPD